MIEHVFSVSTTGVTSYMQGRVQLSEILMQGYCLEQIILTLNQVKSFMEVIYSKTINLGA
jgi:hypothetical protein